MDLSDVFSPQLSHCSFMLDVGNLPNMNMYSIHSPTYDIQSKYQSEGSQKICLAQFEDVDPKFCFKT